MELKSSCRRSCVDAFGQRDERNAQRVQFIEQQNQMAEISPEAVEPPHNQHIELLNRTGNLRGQLV